MNEPRPAMISARPPESRSTVANCWKTRTGSSELEHADGAREPDPLRPTAAAASTVAGAETAKSGRWCSPMPKTSSSTSSASSISSIRFRSRSSGRPPLSAPRRCRPRAPLRQLSQLRAELGGSERARDPANDQRGGPGVAAEHSVDEVLQRLVESARGLAGRGTRRSGLGRRRRLPPLPHAE